MALEKFERPEDIAVGDTETEVLYARSSGQHDKGIFVVNKDGYIGDSTRKEIKYALLKGKEVEYLE